MSLEITAPANLLDPSPETAYFWGRVVGDGAIADNRIRIRTSDETPTCEPPSRTAGVPGCL